MNASMTASLTNIYWGEIGHDEMSQTEKQDFLSQPHIGVLALNNPGQGPLTTPLGTTTIWAATSFISPQTSRKARLITIGERVSLVVQQEQLPTQRQRRGCVTSIDATTEDALLAMATR